MDKNEIIQTIKEENNRLIGNIGYLFLSGSIFLGGVIGVVILVVSAFLGLVKEPLVTRYLVGVLVLLLLTLLGTRMLTCRTRNCR